MKDYRKLLARINKDKEYELVKTSKRKNTVKLKHIPTGTMYTIHPGSNAVRPLEQWLKWVKRQQRIDTTTSV